MKVIQSSAAGFAVDRVDPYKFIELVGRTCYKSEDKITDDSAVKFVKSMYSSKHHAMLEHYHVIVRMGKETFKLFADLLTRKSYEDHINLAEFLHMTNLMITPTYSMCYVSGSFRAFIDILQHIDKDKIGHAFAVLLNLHYPELFPDYEFNGEDDASYDMSVIKWSEFESQVKDEEWLDNDEKDKILSHHIPISCHFVCDRGVSHEFVRHRRSGFAQESTRYCNYSNDKFGKESTVIDSGFEGDELVCWKEAMETSEMMYFALLDKGAKPQMARGVLPTDLKTELWLTTTEEEWQHIINLRYHGTTGAPHPKMLDIMTKAYPDLCSISEHRLK